jgi:mono/diheme cytochrome c family protein
VFLQDLQPATACKGVSAHHDKLVGAVAGVVTYRSTYVLVLSDRVSSQIKSPSDPALQGLEIGIQQNTPAVEVGNALHLTKLKLYPPDSSSPGAPLTDLGAGKIDAAIMWAPLAAALALDLSIDDKISIYGVDRPRDPPLEYAAQNSTPDSCTAAINDELEGSGVLPAELLVPVNIRSLLGQKAPSIDLKAATAGGKVFGEVCAKCHGANAVWDPALAPVDLLRSVRRFQYVGFKYIVMNGRPQKGMPPLRGTISEDQIASVYQYLRARSMKLLPAGPSEQQK